MLTSFAFLAIIPAVNAIRVNKRIPSGIHVAFETSKSLIMLLRRVALTLHPAGRTLTCVPQQIQVPEADVSRTIP